MKKVISLALVILVIVATALAGIFAKDAVDEFTDKHVLPEIDNILKWGGF